MKLLHNAHFYIDGGFNNIFTSLLIDGDRIVNIPSNPLPGFPDLERIDLKGAYVYPGFIDAHTHSFSGGLYQDGVDLSACSSLDEILNLLSEAAKQGGEIIFAWRFDEGKIRDKRFPNVKELDAVCPDSKLLLRRIDGHSCILNSKARQSVTGLNSPEEVLTGADNDHAVNWLQDSCSEETILKAYHAAARAALRGGFTRIHTMVGDAEHSNQHYKLLRDHLNDFPVAFEPYPQSFDIRGALELGATRIGGCILSDGSIGSHTAGLSKKYADAATSGNLYHSDLFWREFAAEAHSHGLQICVHCIGDAAIRQINSAYAHLDKDEVRARRHQLIHCEMTPDPLVAEIAASGAVPVMQPAFDLLWGGDDGFYAQRLGVERARQMNRFASFYKAEVRICGSSDWYVTPLNIGMSLHAAMNHHNQDERLRFYEAIEMYTDNNAWLAQEQSVLGKIAPGFVADLSVMDTDFTAPFDYQASKTLLIFRNGNIVYAAG